MKRWHPGLGGWATHTASIAASFGLTCVCFGLWQHSLWAGLWLLGSGVVTLQCLGSLLSLEVQVLSEGGGEGDHHAD